MPTSSEALRLIRGQSEHAAHEHVTDASEEVFITNKSMYTQACDVSAKGSKYTHVGGVRFDDVRSRSESRLGVPFASGLKQKRSCGGSFTSSAVKGGYYIACKTVPMNQDYSYEYDGRARVLKTLPKLPGIMPPRRILSARFLKESQAVEFNARQAKDYRHEYDQGNMQIDAVTRSNASNHEISLGVRGPEGDQERESGIEEHPLMENVNRITGKDTSPTKEARSRVAQGEGGDADISIDSSIEEELRRKNGLDHPPSTSKMYCKSRPSLLVLSQRQGHMAGMSRALGIRGCALPCPSCDVGQACISKRRMVPPKRTDEVIIRQIEIENQNKCFPITKEPAVADELRSVQSKRYSNTSFPSQINAIYPEFDNQASQEYRSIHENDPRGIGMPSVALSQDNINSLSSDPEQCLVANLNSPGNHGDDPNYYVLDVDHETLVHRSDSPGLQIKDRHHLESSRHSGHGSPVFDHSRFVSSDASASDSSCRNDIMAESPPSWPQGRSPPLLSIIQEESLDDQSHTIEQNKQAEQSAEVVERESRHSRSGITSNGSKASFNKDDHDQFIEEASTLTIRADELLGTKSHEQPADPKVDKEDTRILDAEQENMSMVSSENRKAYNCGEVVGLGKDDDNDDENVDDEDTHNINVNPNDLSILNMMQPHRSLPNVKSAGRVVYRSASQEQRTQLAAFKKRLRSDEAFIKKISPQLLRGPRTPPAPQPSRLCLARGPPGMTHARLMALLEAQAGQGVKVKSVTFDPVYLKAHTPAEAETCRWVFELSPDSNPDWILFKGLVVDGQHIEVRYLDDQLRDEWLQYLKYNAFCRDVKFRRSQARMQATLTCSSASSRRMRKFRVN